MTVRFRHHTCHSLLIVYHGEQPLEKNPVMRSAEWARADGSRFEYGSPLLVTCPDCGRAVAIRKDELDVIEPQKKPPL